MSHRTSSTRNDYKRKISYDRPYLTISPSCFKSRTKTFFIQNKIIEKFPYLNTLMHRTNQKSFLLDIRNLLCYVKFIFPNSEIEEK